MLSENFLKCICLFTFIGLIAGNDAKTVRKNPFSARPYAWNDLACRGRPDGFHPHRNGCEWWLNCLGGSFVAEGSCSDGENFNHNNGQCNSIGSFDCFDDFENYYDDVEPIEPDSGCPPNGSSQLVFLESDYCEDFFICLNGQAIPQTCRDGLHWNVKDSICDFPENAGCEFDLPERMPTCSEPDFTGDLPHPTDCSLFVHCNNGNRSIQRCPHLLYFDRILGRCYIWSLAFCTSN